MSKKAFDVFGLGQCCLDYLSAVDEYPESNSKCELPRLLVQGGGPTATAMVALTRWGMRCAVTGLVGDDSIGSMIRASLADEAVDVSGLIERKGTSSQFAFIVAEPHNGNRTVFWRRPTGQPPKPGEIDVDTLHRSKLFYTDGLFIEAALAAAREAKSAGIPIVVDPGSMRDGMLDLARLSDCFVVSEKFAGEMAARHSAGEGPLDRSVLRRVCEEIADLGPSITGVTLGARGYIARVDGDVIEKPAYDVEPYDTTGCGDVFHAGLAFGIASDWSPEASLDFGAWAAAMVSTELGGRTGIPPLSSYPGHS